jgi:hypothetical protein
MRKERENHWHIPEPARRPASRRDQILRKITLALVTDRPAGINPYDSRLGTSSRDIWGQRRGA